MTDKEIIKALCCCLNAECNECPYEIKGCNVKMCKDALDLINRQQAEIGNLKQEVEDYIAENSALADENLELNSLINDLEMQIDDLEMEIENSIDY